MYNDPQIMNYYNQMNGMNMNMNNNPYFTKTNMNNQVYPYYYNNHIPNNNINQQNNNNNN